LCGVLSHSPPWRRKKDSSDNCPWCSIQMLDVFGMKHRSRDDAKRSSRDVINLYVIPMYATSLPILQSGKPMQKAKVHIYTTEICMGLYFHRDSTFRDKVTARFPTPGSPTCHLPPATRHLKTVKTPLR
jgi:hypothetical protein